MLRGFLRLFTSGLIIHPMVLLGIATGVYLSLNYHLSEIYSLMEMPRVYCGILLVALVYTFVFNRAYKGYSDTVDWKETFNRIIGNVFKLLISGVCTICLFVTIFL